MWPVLWRASTSVAVLSLVLHCTHPFPPPPQHDDQGDHDRDSGLIDQGRRSDGTPRTDLRLDACANEPPPGAPATGACGTYTGWTCIGVCNGAHRFGCFQGSTLLREIRCDAADVCSCRIASQTKTCSKLPLDNGRSGCPLALEHYHAGCCQ